MADDLFNRFRGTPPKPAAPAPPGVAEEDSGLRVRGQVGNSTHVSELEVLAAIERIPSMPVVVQKLLQRAGDLSGSTSGLEDLIKQDMGIAGRLLKLVNSPFYGLPQPVGSIEAAVAITGLASLKSLAVAASTANLLAVDLSGYGFADKGLWTNSVATAALAKAIAKSTGATKDEAEEHFVAGLLRDIGMLVVGAFMTDRKVSLRKIESGEKDILRRERALIGIDHCRVGERIADKWTLPEALKATIAQHHRIPSGADPKTLRQLAAVRLAERLTYTANIGLVKDHPFDATIDGVLIQATGLTAPAFQSLMKDMPNIIKAAEEGL